MISLCFQCLLSQMIVHQQVYKVNFQTLETLKQMRQPSFSCDKEQLLPLIEGEAHVLESFSRVTYMGHLVATIWIILFIDLLRLGPQGIVLLRIRGKSASAMACLICNCETENLFQNNNYENKTSKQYKEVPIRTRA